MRTIKEIKDYLKETRQIVSRKIEKCCKCPKGKEYIWCGCECHKK